MFNQITGQQTRDGQSNGLVDFSHASWSTVLLNTGCLLLINYQLYINNYSLNITGGLAQLARALAWHARGHRFDPDILHLVNEKGKTKREKSHGFFTLRSSLFTLQRSLTY